MHGHGSTGFLSLDGVVGAGLILSACLYLGGVSSSRRRGRDWPLLRTVAWLCGLGIAGGSLLGPLAAAGHDSFPAHMLGHLLIGMVAPLALVAGAPVTLALRSLDPRQARRISRALRSTPARAVSSPIGAGLINVASLWLLYTTPLVDLMFSSTLLHLLVNIHFLFAGYLFTASLVGPDPNPHRAGFPLRAVVLVAALAAHGILAKYLYAHPPDGVPLAQAHSGSMLMYYGGDIADAVLIGILCLQWYRAAGKEVTHRPKPVRLASRVATRGRAV